MSNANYEGPSNKKRRLVNGHVPLISPAEKTEPAKETKSRVRLHKKALPRFRLKTTGESASLSTPNNERIPLVLTDVQHLLLHSLLGNLNLSEPPRWYVLDKCDQISQTTCLVLEGLSIKHWEKHSQKFEWINKIFNDYVEILTPSIYKGSLVQELALVPLSEAEKVNIIQKYGSMNLALAARKDLMVMMKAVFPINDEPKEIIDYKSPDKFPRTQLMLSAWQLIEENYPLPLKGKLKSAYSDYFMSKEEYKPVGPESPMFGVDCEMCVTSAGSELTRVSIVNENHETVYESLVKPYNEITDYLTRFSGITKSMLENVTKRLSDVQQEIRELLPSDAILVGQSLNVDLHALKIMHPYIIDTSSIYNFTGERTRKPKLKTLAKEFLNEDIQCSRKGHDSVEDSLASLKLVQLKLSKSLEFGDAVHTNRQKYKENYVSKLTSAPELALSIFNHMIEQKKSSLVVGCEDITGDYHSYLTQAKDSVCFQLKKGKPKKVKLSTVDGVDEVISTVTEAASNYNFVLAHLKLGYNDNESVDITKIDSWVEKIWKSLAQSSLFVVVFGGTSEDNGVAMMKVKSLL